MYLTLGMHGAFPCGCQAINNILSTGKHNQP